MKPLEMQDSPKQGAQPNNEAGAHLHPHSEDASQGSEFLDDAIRIHDQVLASAGHVSSEND